jgi:Fungal specific transcription factor domain
MIHCGSSTFPPVYFLDKDMFQRSLVEIPRMDFQVSSDILNLNGSTDNVREVASMYFHLVHPWMPFISRKLFYDQLLSPLMPLRAESSLLFACMQLAISLPHSSNPRTSAYLTVKVELFRAEIAGVLTLRLLQAWVLVSLYEIGHAIYPSAYMSIGTCARYADALSITASRESCPDTPRNWVGTEERRRTWWAVRILDW